MKKDIYSLFFLLSFFFCLYSQIPQTLSYQGLLKDVHGTPVANGTYQLTFRIYHEEMGGTPIWNEIQMIPVSEGIFNAILGAFTPLDLPFDEPYWLGVTVGTGTELPRIRLTSSAYSLNAKTVEDTAITTAKIADEAVTQAKLAPGLSLPPGGAAGGDLTGAYPNPSIADNAVNSGKIHDGTIQLTDLAFTPLSRPLSPGVATAEIADNAVTTVKIEDGAITQAKLSPGLSLPPGGTAGGDLTGSYPNPSIAAGAVNSSKIQDGQVGSADIADNSVVTAKINDGAVTQAKLSPGLSLPPGGTAGGDLTGSYPDPLIATGAVTTGKLADNAVASSKILNGSITSVDLADNVVTSAKISDGTVIDADLASNAVTTVKIQDGAVTQAKIGVGVTLPPGGVAGGDLTGTYPNPTVNALQGRGVASAAPTSGQVLKWSGTEWQPGNDIIGGNTLDQSYDQGGPGVGRTIIADAGAFEVSGVDGVLFRGNLNNGTIPIEGSGERMMWYPRKASFRAGRQVGGTSWNDINIGIVSTAFGLNTTASGGWSFAIGSSTTASGDYSVATGITSVASAYASTAMGGANQASGGYSVALGNNNTSSGGNSVAMGGSNIASGSSATAMGYGNIASGNYATALGREIQASGDYSLAIALSDQNGLNVTRDSTMAIMGGRVGIGSVTPHGRLHVQTHGTYAGFFTSDSAGPNTHVIHSEYGATGNYNAHAVYARCRPAEGFGYGGLFLGGAYGIYGSGNGGASTNVTIGTYGIADGSDGYRMGVYGYGVNSFAQTAYAYGVFGYATGYRAYGVYGYVGSGEIRYAGYFVGNVNVTGTLSKAGGSFKIDHPLDPENRYLYHSFVESPDMKNIYDGVVTLDANGEAWVNLPEWFEALNREFRYQLTCVGGYATVYIAEEISGNRFKIAGGKPDLKVSWQVTGIRQDAWAQKNRIPVEEVKRADERGLYLYPEAFGQPENRGLDYQMRKAIEDRKPQAQ